MQTINHLVIKDLTNRCRCFVSKNLHKQLPGYSLDDDAAILFFGTEDEGYNFDVSLLHDGEVFMQDLQQVARQAKIDAANAAADDTNTRMLVGVTLLNRLYP